MVAGIVAPRSVSLVGFLMFGNLVRECGVLNNLSETAQNETEEGAYCMRIIRSFLVVMARITGGWMMGTRAM